MTYNVLSGTLSLYTTNVAISAVAERLVLSDRLTTVTQLPYFVCFHCVRHR